MSPVIHSPVYVSVKVAGETVGLSTLDISALCDSGAVESRFEGKRRLVKLDSLYAHIESLPTVRP